MPAEAAGTVSGEPNMTENGVLFAKPPVTKPCATNASARTPAVAVPETATRTPVILDMGEASREQGFRLNGCR